jgi:large subunit ribosomal protein L10
MARPDKVTAVAEIVDGFRDSKAAVLTEYRGLTVAQLKTLRRNLGSDTTYAVVKNTLTKRAVRESDIPSDAADQLEALLQGPTAIAFVGGDPVEAAKGLRDFAKTYPLLIIKGGVLDGKALTADEIRKLADLESREVLLSKMAGALLASLSNAASLFQAPLAQAARLAEALRLKAEADPSILRGGAGTPAPVAEVVEVPVAEVAEEVQVPAAEAAEVAEVPAAEAVEEVQVPVAEAAEVAEVPVAEVAEVAEAPAAAAEPADVEVSEPAESSEPVEASEPVETSETVEVPVAEASTETSETGTETSETSTETSETGTETTADAEA